MDRVIQMAREQFEAATRAAIDGIGDELVALMDNVAIFIEDEPPASTPGLLGLYEGTPLTERGEWYSGVLPDRITIFAGPILRSCATADQVTDEIAVTVVHEIAHHFGISDERLDELGWG